jgi:hypothetical protein
LLDDLVRSRPSRVILLEPGPTLAAGEIEAWASGSCFRGPGGDTLICSETIHLSAGSGADLRIASVVRSLTVGGMPLEVLVLEGSPLEIAWLAQLGGEVDRVLFRSADLDVGECIELWERCGRRSKSPILDDLTWAAQEGWRMAVASRFDGEAAARLRSLRRVTLSLEGPAKRPAMALLFAGWLGSRLGWTNVRGVSGSGSDSAWTLSGPDGSEDSLLVRGGGGTTAGNGLREVEFGFDGAHADPTWRWNPSEGTIPGHSETACAMILRALRKSGGDATPGEAMRFAQRLGEMWQG